MSSAGERLSGVAYSSFFFRVDAIDIVIRHSSANNAAIIHHFFQIQFARFQILAGYFATGFEYFRAKKT